MIERVVKALVLACALTPGMQAVAQAQDQSVAGPYLAARAASDAHDFRAAAEWFLQALETDPRNPGLIDNCLLALIGLGDLERARPIAAQALSDQVDSQLSHMVLIAGLTHDADWTGILGRLDMGEAVGARVDVLTRGWAYVGAGQQDAALAAFDQASELPGSRGFGTYHKALALGAMARFEDADALLSLPPGEGVPRTRRSVMAHIQIMTELGQNARALETLDAAFGRNMDPAVLAMRQAITTGGIVPFEIVGGADEGIGEVFYTEGSAFIENSPPAIVLLYAQIAQNLHADDAEIIMMTAGLLQELDRYDQAAATYALVRQDDPAFHSAEFGRADVLHRAGQSELAVEVLRAMLRGYPQLAMAHSELGDILRSQGRMQDANAAYTQALDLVPQSDGRHWILRYKRAITSYEMDVWSDAEADLRIALELNPNHAGLLNFLGYSMVERGENLEEALDMIVRATVAEPDNGAIVDSYGWALYKLGRYDEAVLPMERAVQLLPEDPVINDHLGDVYWAVGRRLEAHFQWSRALSFSDDPVEIAQIQDKLENGLEVAMTGETESDVITVAQDL